VFVQAGPARGPPAAAGADASGYRQCPPGPGAAPVSAPVWAAAAALHNPGAALGRVLAAAAAPYAGQGRTD